MTSYHDSHVIEQTGKILVVAIVVLSVVLIFVYFVHLYAKWFLYGRVEDTNDNTHHRRRREDFAAGYHDHQQPGVTVIRSGLNPSLLETIPVIPFDPKQFKLGQELECTVCLSEVNEGEKTRVLPKCNHGFHVECIDMWFYSHSTCPICRNHVVSVEDLSSVVETEQESTDFPTNILFWGDETQVSTLTSQLEEANSYHQIPLDSTTSSSQSQTNTARLELVIDIPLPAQVDCDEDKKTPVSSRMRSLRRILISPFSPAVEQGARGF